MGSLKRKISRKKKKKAEKKFKDQIALFDKLEDNCLTCGKPYDKKSEEHVKSWRVVVREQEGQVRLYCPTCWGKAMSFIEKMEKDDDN
tara:strand:- start:108 stop:371 length:264 start_codon:yes stop_codon:yes gene_type:complete